MRTLAGLPEHTAKFFDEYVLGRQSCRQSVRQQRKSRRQESRGTGRHPSNQATVDHDFWWGEDRAVVAHRGVVGKIALCRSRIPARTHVG